MARLDLSEVTAPFATRRRLLATASTAVMLIAASAAHAQTQTSAPPDTASPSADQRAIEAANPASNAPVSAEDLIREEAATEPEGPGQDIVVTGSLIARPDYKANSPIVSVTKEALEGTGQITVERALSQLPQFTGGFGQNNTGSTGTGLNGGQSYATLRGLGSKRTLLLMDGKRLQPSNPDGSVDLNTIPEALIGNVEVITGGASTTYGSDATAGVVNFRLRRDFTGLTLNGQYGTTTYGDGDTYRLTGTFGGNFDDGRGRAVLSVDYSKRDRAKRRERPWFSDRTPQTGNAASYHGSAVFTGNEPTLASVNGVLAGYGVGPLVASNGSLRYSGGAQIGFNTDGTLFTANGVPALNFREPETDDAYLVDSGNTIYGPSKQMKFGFTGGDLQTDMERYQFFGRADYEISDNVDAFGQFSYTTYDQSSIVNTTLSNNVYLQSIPYNNPFIPADLRTILASRVRPTADFQFHKAFNAIGNRGQGFSYDVWQVMGGLSGKVGLGDLTWEIYGSTSRSKFYNTQTGGLSVRRVNQLTYSPTGGTDICEGGLNLFGNRPISDDCAEYIKRDTLNTTEMMQHVVQATVQGGLFELPAGEVRFAVGESWRKNTFDYKSDDALDQPDGTSDIIGFSVLRSSSGSVDVGEIFGELFVPVLHDIPAIKQLNLDLGYRFSNYSSIGAAHTYKADVDWEVIESVRLRGGYNRSIRAPSVGELYAPVSTGSISIGNPGANVVSGDPCDVRSSFRAGPNAAQVRALCLSQGMAESTYAGFIGTQQIFPLTGGNPDLEEETADTWSVGAVIDSPFSNPMFSRMQLSVDYYKIDVTDAIGVLSVVQSVQNCFNVGGTNPTYDPNNYYCTLLARSPQGPLEPPTNQPLLNLGSFGVSGVDVQFDWRMPMDGFGLGEGAGDLNFRTVVSYLDSFNIQSLPTSDTINYVGTIGASVETNAGITHPRWKANTSLVWSKEGASFGITWRFIDKMKYFTAVTAPTTAPPGIDAYNVFDLNASYVLPYDIGFRIGVTNVFNAAPPSYGSTPETYDGSTYDTVGRYFFTSLSKKF
jgi:iron complex outermembrane receptor protein